MSNKELFFLGAFFGAISFAVAVCGFFVLWLYMGASYTPPVSNNSVPVVSKTDKPAGTIKESLNRNQRLDGNGEPALFAAKSEEYNSRLIRLCNANDEYGIRKMVSDGQVLVVDSGTPCLVINSGIFVCEARITSGPYAGQIVHVPSEFVKP